MRVIGVNLSHDASICLLVDGRLEVAIALERFLRVKRAAVPLRTLIAALHDAFNAVWSRPAAAPQRSTSSPR